MSLSAADIALVSAWLAATDIAELELHGPDCHLRLHRGDGNPAIQPQPTFTHIVTAASVGTFLPTHPLHDAPLAPIGAVVAAGQTIALLAVGALLLPVVAPVAGMVAAFLAPAGRAIGYGTPLVELHLVED